MALFVPTQEAGRVAFLPFLPPWLLLLFSCAIAESPGPCLAVGRMGPMTRVRIPLGHLAASARHWARHLRMSDLRPLPGAQWEDAGTRGEGLGTRPGPLQALSADREASQRRKGRERKQANCSSKECM